MEKSGEQLGRDTNSYYTRSLMCSIQKAQKNKENRLTHCVLVQGEDGLQMQKRNRPSVQLGRTMGASGRDQTSGC